MAGTNDPLIGRTLDGRYRIDELVARGGMATVYRATDTRLDRVVAVKVLSSTLVSDPGFVQRFLHEAKATAALTHPNVVAVHDQGVADGYPFLVMEYVAGRTIRDVLRENGPFTPAHALEIMKSVLSGLVAAHSAGFVHRDIKPENVLITSNGHVKVTDFGLARVIDDTPVSDSTGQVLLGTMAYLSPEQVQQHALDERSDVYSAGILLFEMLTGRVPFTGTSPLDVAYQHVNQDVPAPSTLEPDVPPAIDHLVLAATRRNRDDRIQSAHSFLESIGRAMAGVPEVERIDQALPLADSSAVTVTRPQPAVVEEPGGRGSHRASSDQPAERPVRRSDREPVRRIAGRDSRATTTDQRVAAVTDSVVSAARRLRMPSLRRPELDWQDRRTQGIIAGVMLALVAIIGVQVSGSYAKVPSVATQTQDEATATLVSAGFATKVIEEFSEDIPVGTVVRTDPASGARARSGSTVTMFVSKGQERYTVPEDIAGMSVSEATATLEALTLTVTGTQDDYSDTIAQGQVITTDPAPGELLKRGTAVTLIVSKGPEPVDVPAIYGKDVDEVAAILKRSGLKIEIIARVFDSSESGTVIWSDPLPGTTVARGSTVQVKVSKGPQTVAVPNVVGMKLSKARAALKALGFKVTTRDMLPFYNPADPEVVSQSIPSGTQAVKGSTILLSTT